MLNNNISVEEYLQQKGAKLINKIGSELTYHCLFNGCDKDSKGSEAHLYFSSETGQYECKKCGKKGNLVTLKRFFGDEVEKQKRNIRTVTPTLVEKYHNALPERIREYLKTERGLTDEIINSAELGYGTFYGQNWITIPIKDIDGNYKFFKLRQDPEKGNAKRSFPAGESEAEIYDWNYLFMENKQLIICEGEMDALLLRSKGYNAVTSTHGANTFKTEWLNHFKKDIKYYICYDNDEAGRKGSHKVADLLLQNEIQDINIITLPEEVGEKGDVTDYFVKLKLSEDDLFSTYSCEYPAKIKTDDFPEITIQEVNEVLDDVIKKDDENKAITFISMLLTYTEDSQMNVMFNAPSSTGKSHIPMAIKELFPKDDIRTFGYCSPTAFFHEQGLYDKETNTTIVDLSKKILIFLDMPSTDLLTRLRPLLSHDEREITAKITDKSSKGGNKTKVAIIRGFPSVYFCSANAKVDEQETTRFIVLSPSIEHDKVIAGINQSVAKESDKDSFAKMVFSNPGRDHLKQRIKAIKQEKIVDVKIRDIELVKARFLPDLKNAKPRQQRDVKKVIGLIKGLALMNVWFREREGGYIWANENDINEAFKLWQKISTGQDYGIPAYIYDIYVKIILPVWFENTKKDFPSSVHVTRKEIIKKYNLVYNRHLSMYNLRLQILPQLEAVGLLIQERSNTDSREMVVIPQETEIFEKNKISCEGVESKTIYVENVEAEPEKLF
jgi:hypothetical protein